ncbi:MAG: carboxypeptidase regulatory-like domain-containing protein, partial [Acidobacteriota bacterium]
MRFWTLMLLVACTWAQPAEKSVEKGFISGRVLRGAEPAARAQVLVRNGTFETGALADDQGRYTVRDLAPGDYEVATTTGVRRSVRLRAGESLSNIDLLLPSRIEVSGRITDENGEPVRDASVFLVAHNLAYGEMRYMVWEFTGTNERGEYRFLRAEPGRSYVMMARKQLPRDQNAYETLPA